MPERINGGVVHPGALSLDLTTVHGYEPRGSRGSTPWAASATRSVPLIRYALGTLDRVVAVVRSLNFVVCTPGFHDIHLVADGVTDLLRDVFGEDAGIGGRATVGVTSLARNHCFETWLTLEVRA